eukprot:gene18435-biopygen21955
MYPSTLTPGTPARLEGINGAVPFGERAGLAGLARLVGLAGPAVPVWFSGAQNGDRSNFELCLQEDAPSPPRSLAPPAPPAIPCL